MDEFKQCVSPYSRYEVNKNGVIRNFLTKQIKKSRQNTQGYLRISLVNDLVENGIYKVNVVTVHKIVILNYIGEAPSNKHTIDHINGNKIDNTLNNLRWATPKEQAINRNQAKTTKQLGNSNVSILQYDMNNNFIKQFKNALEVTQQLGINKTNLSSNCLGKAKSAGGFIFKYKYKDEIQYEDEIWKDFTFNNKQIQVSTYGRVKSNNKLLKGCISSQTGYIVISISNNKIRKNELVHRLVAKCFLDNPYNKNIVNHKDQNKQNNHIDNLEWCTYSENAIHFYKGPGKNLCKKVQQLDKNKNVIKIFDSLSEAAKFINIKNKSQITIRIINQKLYHGYYWKYSSI
jgi:hypothetical protein